MKKNEVVPVNNSVNNEEKGKMTIYDYEEKYVKRQNTKGIKFLLNLIIVLIGVVIFTCLFLLVIKIYEMQEYAGYGAGIIAIILYIVFFIIPVVKVMKSDYFITNVNRTHAKEAKAHNKKVRLNIATKIVDFNATVSGAGWYDSAKVLELEAALYKKDDKRIKDALTDLYNGSVRKTAKEIIHQAAKKAALYSALSQSSKLDAAIVAFINLQMVKDLVFLYGFRPSDAKLIKIYANVLENTLVAYGVSSFDIGKSAVKTMGGIVNKIPILGSVISTVIDSSIQGLTNGALTTIAGYQSIKFINQEYHLQSVLDEIEIEETENDVNESVKELEEELKNEKKDKNIKETPTEA
ncbi:MAG: DUF697 domain-containing protein [Bacilli bacterium]|nr:DUF697 domain-containing protein [Bacilli bacterium]